MKRKRTRTSVRVVSQANLSITREARHVAELATHLDSRIVTLGPLILFSTDTGDGWMLDPADQLAVCLAREGARVPVAIVEDQERFAVEWTHGYEIDGDRMTFVDQSGRATTVMDYPTTEIVNATRRVLG